MTDDRTSRSVGPVAILSVASAIAVFGAVYGAAALPLLGPTLTIASSILMFSGAAQFSMVGLLAAGGGPATVLGVVATLSLRHLALGAIVRPRLGLEPLERAGVAWFLIDETAGLAVADQRPPSTTLVRSGAVCYAAWIAGTGLGVVGAGAAGLQDLAAAIFPILFIGLAALMSTRRELAVRALIAGGLVWGLLAWSPQLGGLVPLLGAALVALPGERS